MTRTTTHTARGRAFPFTLITLLMLSFCALPGCSTLSALNPFSEPSGEMLDGGVAPDRADESKNTTSAESAAVTEDAKHTAREGTAAKQSRPSTSVVEVIWQVPTEAVDTYHLYYGLNEESLDNHVAIPISNLEKTNHPRFGAVFRYRLRDVPANQTIYLSLRAENRNGMSNPTPTAKIEPGQQTVTP